MTLTQPPLLQITSLSATIPSCIPGNDAMITVTAAGGTSPFSYSINGGTYQTANTFNAIGIGNYIITIKDANNCTVSSNIAVTSPNSPTITSMSATLATCNPGCDASISLTASGGTGALQYAINGGAFQNNTVFNNLCANNYTVVVSDVVGCTYSSQISVNTVNGPVLTNVAVNQIPCYGAANGSFSLTVSGGTSPLNYTLNPGSVVNNNGVFNALSPNTYNVQVVDANGCSIVTAATIVQPTQMQFSNVSSTSALCNGVNNGSISFVFSGGTGTSNFTILPAGTFTAPNSFTGLAGNQTYTLTATDANGCTVSAINTVAQPPSLIIDSVSSTAVTCNGANNGSIQISASGGSGQITYTMTPGGLSNTTGTFVNLPGNIFTITATDANGCSISTSVSIINPSSLLIANASATDVICFGQNNGSISLLAGGGIGMISYQLLPVNVSNSTGQFPALGPGTYDAIAFDANGCSDTVQLIVNEPALVQFTSVVANGVLCSGQNNGALTVAAAGGVGVISYTVQPGGQSNTTGIFNSLSGNQTYTVTASDVNGCTTVTTVFVVLPSAMSIDSVNQINVDCFGAGNGMVLMTVSGGTGLINYALNPGAIINQTGVFSNLNGNVYVITATDANGCSLSTTFNVTEPTALQFSTAASTNIICFGQVNGSVSVTASGGVSSYTYSMNPGNLSNQNGSFTGLLANVYTTTVTDANNCTLSTTLVVIEPPLVKFDSVQKQNVKCFGQSNGSIQAFAGGGVGPLNYSITPQPSTNTTGLFNGLPTGSYTITISDSKGCTAMTTVNIFQPQPLVETLVSTSNVTCYGGNDGSIVVSASGGTQPYLFNLQPVNVSSSLGNYPAVSAGVYTMYVSDFNGCQDSIPGIVITQPTPIVFTSVTHEDITCYYDTTGSISVQAQGGTGALVFTLTPQKGIQSSWGQFDNLSGGPYTVTAIDASGCTVTTLVVIKQNLEIVASDVQLNQPICHGDANGSIYISALGGVAPLTYSMNGGPFINPGIYLNLVAGTYAFTIMDALGCVKDTSLILTEPDIVHGDIEIEDIRCPGKADGIVRVKGTGGRADYTYYLKPGLNFNKNGNFYNLEVGEYTLTVKDSSNCVFDTVIQIKEADNAMSLNFDKKNLGCFGFGNEGWAEVKVSGGTPPFTYAWNTSPVMTDARIENLRYGYYQVNVSDANGCEVSDKVYIEPGPCCEEVYLPNAFSPNNDGKNDEWRVVTSVGLELIQLVIYNRWGNKVWETYDVANGWDGTYKGDKMDTETYFYLFRYKCLHDGKNYTKKGDIILLR
jgi:gliding motility-associated-like protein